MSLLRSAPLRQKSSKAIARDKRLAKTKKVLLARSRGLCDIEKHPLRGHCVDHHHVFGRHALGPVWSDSAEAGAVLCREHHDDVERTPGGLHDRALQVAAVVRLIGRLEAEGGKVELPVPASMEYQALAVVEALEALGVEP